MVRIPLALRLKKQAHKEIASAQDIIVRELYNVFEEAVLHGGTAIWRCYQGNRFSEDIDAYIPRDEGRIDTLFENLERKGFIIKKRKVGGNSLFSVLELNGCVLRFEALFKRQEGFLKEYETSDGNLITVYTLTPEGLVKEKIAAYLKRLKIRDLYDVFFLLRYVEEKKEISKELRGFVQDFKKPIDEKELKVLIVDGLVPGVEKMLEYIRRW
jgi:predicted nucleotidyltransferase component of viral defense system